MNTSAITAPLIDSHCHLDFSDFDHDRDKVIDAARNLGICNIIIPGAQKKHWSRINKICRQYDICHPCYGLHPYWIEQHDEKDIKSLESYIREHQPVGLGECGLDFRQQFIQQTDQLQDKKQKQLFFFEQQLQLASNFNLPVVIHSVKATQKVIDILNNFPSLTGMIHSYSGSAEQAEQLINLNFMISLGGLVTYEKAKKVRQVATQIPLDALLIETDSPDQVDVSNHGERNSPAYLPLVLEEIAKLRDDDESKIAAATTANAKQLFGLIS